MSAHVSYPNNAAPARCIPAISVRIQDALEAHAASYPNAKTIAVSVVRASTLEVCSSIFRVLCDALIL
jgi:hypothetical protein